MSLFIFEDEKFYEGGCEVETKVGKNGMKMGEKGEGGRVVPGFGVMMME